MKKFLIILLLMFSAVFSYSQYENEIIDSTSYFNESNIEINIYLNYEYSVWGYTPYYYTPYWYNSYFGGYGYPYYGYPYYGYPYYGYPYYGYPYYGYPYYGYSYGYPYYHNHNWYHNHRNHHGYYYGKRNTFNGNTFNRSTNYQNSRNQKPKYNRDIKTYSSPIYRQAKSSQEYFRVNRNQMQNLRNKQNERRFLK